MANFTGGLLSYTAVHGCCNFHHWSSCCFVLCAAPGAQTHQWAKGAGPWAMTGQWARSPTPGKVHLGWCSVCSQVRAVWEFCLPHLLFFSPRQPHWCVSVPALLLQFIQCGYLWALDSAHQRFECNFFTGIWALFSFSFPQYFSLGN